MQFLPPVAEKEKIQGTIWHVLSSYCNEVDSGKSGHECGAGLLCVGGWLSRIAVSDLPGAGLRAVPRVTGASRDSNDPETSGTR